MGGFVFNLTSRLRRLGASILGSEQQPRTQWTGQPIPREWRGGVRPQKSTTLKPDSLIVSGNDSMPPEADGDGPG